MLFWRLLVDTAINRVVRLTLQPRRLSYFLSLFPNLDDIEILRNSVYIPYTAVPDTELIPFSAPKLSGKVTLSGFSCVETWTHLIASCGGLRFRHMELRVNATCAPVLLEACAKTLETLRFNVADGTFGK